MLTGGFIVVFSRLGAVLTAYLIFGYVKIFSVSGPPFDETLQQWCGGVNGAKIDKQPPSAECQKCSYYDFAAADLSYRILGKSFWRGLTIFLVHSLAAYAVMRIYRKQHRSPELMAMLQVNVTGR